MNKKGNVQSILIFGVLLLAIGVTFFIGNYIGKTVNNELVKNPQINASASVQLTNVNTAIDKFDYIFLAVYIGLILGTIVTSWYVSSYPIFMWIYFFVLIFIVAISTILSKIWTELVSSSVWASTLLSFPITNNILQNLPLHLTVMGLIGLLVLFGKPFFQEGF